MTKSVIVLKFILNQFKKGVLEDRIALENLNKIISPYNLA